MKKDDKEWKRPFTSGDLIDDFIDWAQKLKALGEVWSALSWHRTQGEGETDTLDIYGETLGSIVVDYAELISNTVKDNSQSFYDLKKNDKLLARAQEVYDFIKQEGFSDSTRIDAILYQIEQLDDLVENVANPAIRLKEGFEELKKKIMAQKQKAPVTVSAATGA